MAVVLVVDDDVDVNAVLTRLLTDAGFIVLSAPDGATALRIALDEQPDVVLTDLDMPGLNGLQLCQAIRDDPLLARMPMGSLSGSLRLRDPRVAEVRACGAWLKPFANAMVVSAVQKLLASGRHDHDDLSPCNTGPGSTGE